MKSDLQLRQDELVSNPHARLAICLCLDTSGSMAGEPIAELNEGVAYLFDALRVHDVAKDTAEIAIVTFGEEARTALAFASLDRQTVPVLTAGGMTPMAAGVNLALDLIEKARREYANAGIQAYRPWLILMSDGAPTDPEPLFNAAAQRASDLANRRRLAVIPIGVGPKAHHKSLAAFSPRRPPGRLKGLEFEGFFEWVNKSIEIVSLSQPSADVENEEVKLAPVDGGWPDLWANP